MGARKIDRWDRIGRAIATALRDELEPRPDPLAEPAPPAAPSRIPGRQSGWLDPWLVPWGAAVGGPPPAARIARMVTELRAAGEPMEQALEAWGRYLAETEPVYASPQHFQSRWRSYLERDQPRAASKAQETARAVAAEVVRRGRGGE